jgi:nicotinamide-nucleotide amidase
MKKRLEIIAVGNEVLTGATVNTNAAWLARAAFGIGWETGWMTTVGDEPEEITKALQCAVKRAGAVLVSGGLGPTEDDLTLAVAASTFGVKLHLDEQILAKIEARFRARGLVMPQTNRSQAMVPIGAEVLVNPSGTAPGIWWQPDNLVPIAFMPGVPGELRDIWKTALREKLLSMVDGMVLERWLHMTGVGESALMEQLAPLVADLPVEVFPYAGNFQVSLRLVARGINSLEMMSQLEQCEEIIRQVAGEFCYGKNEDTLESAIGDLLIAKGKTLAVAESCTGGLISSRLTDVAGASNWIAYNVVAYANQKKI